MEAIIMEPFLLNMQLLNDAFCAVYEHVTLFSDADPARLERTQTAWDVQLILDELLTSATAGGPVWSITPK